MSEQAPHVAAKTVSIGTVGRCLTGRYIPLSLISGGCQQPTMNHRDNAAPNAMRTAQFILGGFLDLNRLGSGAFGIVNELNARRAAKWIANRHSGANGNGDYRMRRGGVFGRGGCGIEL